MSAFPADLTGTWTIDEGHSTVGFAVKHAVVATTRGKFTSYSGGATIDAESPESSSIWVEIDAASVDTGNEQRDGHLKSADFWNAEENPKITYKSTSVKVAGDEVVTTGDLTIGGKTNSVDITWEFGGVAKDPWGNVKAGFEGTATINRSDWGITWNAALETGGFLIADKVKLVLEIEAGKQA
ncbi:MAG: YceI family protein [Actinobacteria bacterium]|nr:YceI family protein [Actinomycetota bacterium]